MPQAEHPLDSVAEDVISWVRDESQWYVDAIRGDYRSPFSAPASEQEKLDYYTRHMFQKDAAGNPDFTKPDNQWRDAFIKEFGLDNYSTVATAVMAHVNQKQSPGLQNAPEPLQEMPQQPPESAMMTPGAAGPTPMPPALSSPVPAAPPPAPPAPGL